MTFGLFYLFAVKGSLLCPLQVSLLKTTALPVDLNDPLFSGHPESCWTKRFKPLSPVPTGYSKGIYEKSCLEAGGKYWVMWAAWSRAWLWCVTRHPPRGKAGSWVMLPGSTEPQWAPFTNYTTPQPRAGRVPCWGCLFQNVAMKMCNQKESTFACGECLWLRMRQGWRCTMTFRAGRDCGVYSEGDFNLGFAEPQQSEQALRGWGQGWSELPYYFYLGCPSWHHPEWFAIFLFYLYFTIYLFHIWLLPYEY